MLRSTIHLPPIEEGEFLLCYVKLSSPPLFFRISLWYTKINSNIPLLNREKGNASGNYHPLADS